MYGFKMKHNKISPKKRKFIELLKTKDINEQAIPEIAKEIGISVSTYYRWFRNSELLKIAEEENAPTVAERLPDILETLVKKALQGDMRAIKIFLERYDDNKDDKNIAEKLTPDRVIEIIRIAKKEREEKNNED